MKRTAGGTWAALTGLLLGCFGGCTRGTSTRYVAAREAGSTSSVRYVRDRQTGQWVNRACELRVDAARALPDPIQDAAHGNRLSVQLFGSLSVQSAYFYPNGFDVRDGYRIWLIRHVLHRDDLDGRTAIGVQVEWPEPGAEPRYEPLELFHLPPLDDEPPDQWSDWREADTLRAGGFAWWSEAHNAPNDPVPPSEHPFSLRCKLTLDDVPGVLR